VSRTTHPLIAVLLIGTLTACSAGKQTLGYAIERDASSDASGAAPDFADDTLLPWYGGPAYHGRWPNGLSASVSYVPIGVWMQSPENAEWFREAGMNLFIGLWEGPTDDQLDQLGAAGSTTFCGQTGVWQSRLDDRAMSGWLIETSPDNAQELPEGGYGPCIEPEVTQAEYSAMTEADDSRPVMLLLGQAVADAEWPGRGSCDGRDEMYFEYAEAADVLGFYFYPVSRDRPIELIATGVTRLLEWSRYRKPIIALIEASSIEGGPRPTPEQIRAEAWLALVHGAAGIGYYCHRFMPDFSETDCLEHEPTRAMLQQINTEVREVAPALNSSIVGNGVTVESDAPIATRLARVSGATYLFAAALSNEPTAARFSLRSFSYASAEVIGEDRDIAIEAGELSDDFDGYSVHLYRIAHGDR
jgi:hypothetical protein